MTETGFIKVCDGDIQDKLEEHHENQWTNEPLYHVLDEALALEVHDILWNDRLIDTVSRASADTTSELESFHAQINRNAPKMSNFSYSGILSR